MNEPLTFPCAMDRRKRRVLRRLPILFYLLIGAPNQGYAENLTELLDAARENDHQYLAVKHQYQASLARLDQALAGFLPTFSLNANGNLNTQNIKYVGITAPERNQQYDTYGYTLQMNQPLYRRQNFVVLDQAEAQVAQAQAQIAQAEVELVTRLAQLYYESIQAKAALAAAETQRQLAAAQSDAFNFKYAQQSAAMHEKMEADSRLNIAIAQEVEAASELNNKLFAINQITGLNLTARTMLEDGGQLPGDLQTLEFWLEMAESQNPNVLLQQATRTVARLEIDKARSGHYPTMDLVANYGLNKQGPSASLSTATMVNSGVVGIQVTVPIYSGGLVTAKTEEAISLLAKINEDFEAAKKQAKLQVFQAFNAIISNQTQLKAFEQALTAYQQTLAAANQGLQAGTKTPAEVFNARQQLSSTQKDAVKSKTNILLSHIRLRAAIGDLGS